MTTNYVGKDGGERASECLRVATTRLDTRFPPGFVERALSPKTDYPDESFWGALKRRDGVTLPPRSHPICLLAVMIMTAATVFVHPKTVCAGELPYQIVDTYPHDEGAFTQGLAFDDIGALFEGTGKYGQSSLRRVDLQTGQVLQSHSLEARFFGEGITVMGDRIIQLTWREHTGFVYDKDTFELLDEFQYPTEGWGITHNGDQLIMSNGSAELDFLDPHTFEVSRSVMVRDADGQITRLNELEYIDGLIYANVWLTDRIVVIDPQTGFVEDWLDMTGLLNPSEARSADVLNGIAYDEATDRLLVTGKLWPQIFQVQIVSDPASVPLQAGDADQDLDFDQLDLVQVQIAGKYLTGQAATWGDGDWNGAPGGQPENPPVGDGIFNQFDIIAAQQAAVYLSGPYAAAGPDGPGGDDADLFESSVGGPVDHFGNLQRSSFPDHLLIRDTSVRRPADENLPVTDREPNALASGVWPESIAAPDASAFGSGIFSFADRLIGPAAHAGAADGLDLAYVPEPTSALLLAVGVCCWIGHFGRLNRSCKMIDVRI